MIYGLEGDAPPRPWPAWLVVLAIALGGIGLAAVMAAGGDLRCERLADTAQACTAANGTAP